MILQVENLHQYGLIKDIPSWDAALPINAITEAENVAFRDGAARKQEGYTLLKTLTLTGSPSEVLEVPGFANPGILVPHVGKTRFVYQASLAESDVTRAGGDYASGLFRGGPFHDGFVCTNASVEDLPQWMESVGSVFINLPNWPSTYRCDFIGGYQDFMMALAIRKSTTYYGNMLKWSHGASPGSYPDSWDETDPALDAGEVTLDEEVDRLVCFAPMGDLCIVYGQNTTWLVQPSGDSFIFSFRKLFDFGISQWFNVAVMPDGRHVLCTRSGDIVVHSGSRVDLLAVGKVREFFRGLFASPYSIGTTRVVVRETRKEVWFVHFPGVSYRALVWHWPSDAWSYIPDLGMYCTTGCVDPAGLSTKAAREVWGVDAAWRLHRVGNVYQRAGVAYTSYLKRENICHLPSEQGPAHAPSVVKLLTAIWPRLQSADTGATYTFYATGKMNPNDTGTTKSGAFTPGTGSKVDLYVPGRYFDIKFQDANASLEWKLDGFGLDLSPIGGM